MGRQQVSRKSGASRTAKIMIGVTSSALCAASSALAAAPAPFCQKIAGDADNTRHCLNMAPPTTWCAADLLIKSPSAEFVTLGGTRVVGNQYTCRPASFCEKTANDGAEQIHCVGTAAPAADSCDGVLVQAPDSFMSSYGATIVGTQFTCTHPALCQQIPGDAANVTHCTVGLQPSADFCAKGEVSQDPMAVFTTREGLALKGNRYSCTLTTFCERSKTDSATQVHCVNQAPEASWCADGYTIAEKSESFDVSDGRILSGVQYNCAGLSEAGRAVFLANADSIYDGATDCVLNARQSLWNARKRAPATFPFKSASNAEEVVATLIPRTGDANAIGAIDIGRKLVREYKTFIKAQKKVGMFGWHAVNIAKYKAANKDRMYPNGIVFSHANNSTFGHVSTHTLHGNGNTLSMDQYSTRYVGTSTSAAAQHVVLTTLPRGTVPSSNPAIAERTNDTAIFQWCNESWGCPSAEFLLAD